MTTVLLPDASACTTIELVSCVVTRPACAHGSEGAALADWLGTEPAPSTLELEGFLCLLLADQGTAADLCMALETTAQQVRDRHAEGLVIVRELLATVGAFPGWLRLIEPLVYF
jgi:hypothetical protein